MKASELAEKAGLKAINPFKDKMRCAMRRRILAVLICLVVLTSAVLGAEQKLPSPPRNGRHSVQMIVGGRNTIPLCIAPPKQFRDGTSILPKTPVTIVVYRSRQEGRGGTYTEKAGEGVGWVGKEWVDVTANVPPDKTNFFYLASSAAINGVESDLNNQWLTVKWWPGGFQVLEYPPAGANPGSPPSRTGGTGPQDSATPLVYLPDSFFGFGQAGSSASGKGYLIKLPNMSAMHKQLGSLSCGYELGFTADAAGKLQGAVNARPLLEHYGHPEVGWQVAGTLEHVTGTLQGGSFRCRADCRLDLKTNSGSCSTMVTDLTFSGTQATSGAITGSLRSVVTITTNNLQPDQEVHDFRFEAVPTGGGGGSGSAARLVRSGEFASDLGRPGAKYPLATAVRSDVPRDTSQERYSRWLRDTFVMGTVRLEVGETRTFQLIWGNRRRQQFDRQTLQPVATRQGGEAEFGDLILFTTPRILQHKAVGGAIVQVKALAPGRGEVWASRQVTVTYPDGTSELLGQISIWIVLVSPPAVVEYKRHQISPSEPQPSIDVPLVSLDGRALMRGSGKPVAGAEVTLRAPEGRVYSDPNWVTDEKGRFVIRAIDLLKSGECEILVLKRSRATGDVGVGDDLWPVRKCMVLITKERAAKGSFRLPDIIMDYARNIDFTRR
jgi:hypothetical protein